MFIPTLLFLCLFISMLEDDFVYFVFVLFCTEQTVILLFCERRLLSVKIANFNQKSAFENLGSL